MKPQERRAHALRGLQARCVAFGTGPKWTFSVDADDADCVGYVECDLAGEHVPPGEANVSYSSHPAHRRRGYVRTLRLLTRVLAARAPAKATSSSTWRTSRRSRSGGRLRLKRSSSW